MKKTGKCFICGGGAEERRDEFGKPYRILLCKRRECQAEAWRLVRKAAARLPRPEKKPEAAKAKSEKKRGEFRNTCHWQKVRRKIKERDLYMCQVCVRNLYDYGARRYNGKDISVHHIVPLREDYTLRDDSGNLITLCDCHHKMADNGEISRAVLLQITYEQEHHKKTPPEG